MQHQKQLFNLPADVTYLNLASQSPSTKAIEKAGYDAVLQKSNPHTITVSHYFEPVAELKKLFAQIINVDDYNRIANIPSVSYGMATVANNIKLKKDDEIVVIEEQFPSNIYIWQKLAKKYNAKIITVKGSNAKEWNENILAVITSKTAVVTLGNIHWTNGAIFDLKKIRLKTRQHNALLIIDGSQSIGALPFSAKEIEPDALVCAGYKWLFGPYGCGYAYFGEYFDNGNPIEENWSNRLESEELSKLTLYQPKYKPLANRYCVGENGSFIYVNMQIAALKQVLAWTPEAIQSYCKNITKDSIATFESLGCTIEDSSQRSSHLFGLQLPKSIDTSKLKTQLQEQKIFVSFRGDYIRLSCHYYNTKEDFEKLARCIASAI